MCKSCRDAKRGNKCGACRQLWGVCLFWTLGGLYDTSLTFHEGCVSAAVVVKVSAVGVVQAVVSQALRVAETLQDTVHETLRGETTENSLIPDAPTPPYMLKIQQRFTTDCQVKVILLKTIKKIQEQTWDRTAHQQTDASSKWRVS